MVIAADGAGRAYWVAYFTDWSLCLMCVSAALGVLVSLKYLLTSYHTSKVIVHGRPGLTPCHRQSQYACSAASTSDLENMILPDHVGLTDRRTSSHPLMESPWEMHNTGLENSASNSRDALSPRSIVSPKGQIAVSQTASASLPTPVCEAAFVQPKRLCRTPSDLESMAPAELLYAPQVAVSANSYPCRPVHCSLCCI